jgi:hypothetical protein
MVEKTLSVHESGQEIMGHCMIQASIVIGELSARALEFGKTLLGSQMVAVKGGNRRRGSENASCDEVDCGKSLDEHADLSAQNQEILRRN